MQCKILNLGETALLNQCRKCHHINTVIKEHTDSESLVISSSIQFIEM